MPRGPSKPRFTDPAFSEAMTNALRRYKDGQNPNGKILRNKEMAEILKVSQARISRLLKKNPLRENEKPQDLSALSMAMALRAGVTVRYGDIELGARRTGQPDSDERLELAHPVAQQISFVFEAGFVCEKTGPGVTVRRKGPMTSPKLSVQIKVG
jgi:hypothetical protein